MKIRNISFLASLALLLTSITFTSCSSDDNSLGENQKNYTLELDSFLLSQKVEGGSVWENTLTPSENTDEKVFFSNSIFTMSHYVTASEWGTFWRGFTISNSTDKAEHLGSFHEQKMYGTMGSSDQRFLVANAQTYPEDIAKGTAIDLDKVYAYIALENSQDTKNAPQSVWVTNAPYAYYTMKEGDQFAKKFEKGDYFKLLIHALDQDQKVMNQKPVEFYLANFLDNNSNIVQQWERIDLRELKNASYLVFYLESSDSGQFGMNTPAYFTLKDLDVIQYN